MMRETPWLTPCCAAESLWYSGFMFAEFELSPAGSYEVVFVPEELLEQLPPVAKDHPVLAAAPSPPDIGPVQRTDLLLDDMCTVLAFIQAGQSRLGHPSKWADRDFDRLKPQLTDARRDRLELLTALVTDLDWLSLGESGKARLVSGPVTTWLQQETTYQRETLADAWIECSPFDELRCLPAITLDEARPFRHDPRLPRRAILRQLAECAPATWYAITDLTQAIKARDPDFQRPGGDYDAWYLRDANTGEYLSGFESWESVEGRLLRYILTGPLVWLGLAVTDSLDETSASMYRLSDEGSAYLGRGKVSPAPPEPPGLAVGADFTIRVPAARRFERFQLARVADWVAGGDPFVYRISPSSLERAEGQGISVERVVDFLRTRSGDPVPRSVLDALMQWDTHRSAARIETVCLLTTTDAETMDQIARSPVATRAIVRQVGPAAATVRSGDAARLVEELGRLAILTELAPDR
jgi:hypothetical protein